MTRKPHWRVQYGVYKNRRTVQKWQDFPTRAEAKAFRECLNQGSELVYVEYWDY